jgi:hypothetical protein
LAKTDPKSAAFTKLKEQRDELWRQRASWARGLPVAKPAGDRAMVKHWHRLGFLVSHSKDGAPLLLDDQPQVVETERDESFKEK